LISQRKDEFQSAPFVWLHSALRLANDRQNFNHLDAVCGTFAQLTEVEVEPEDVVVHAQGSSLGYLQHWIRLILQKTSNASVKKINQTSQYLVAGRDFRTFSRFALDWFSKLSQTQQEADSDPIAEVFARYEEERSVWKELMREITESLGQEISLEAFLQEL